MSMPYFIGFISVLIPKKKNLLLKLRLRKYLGENFLSRVLSKVSHFHIIILCNAFPLVLKILESIVSFFLKI